MVIGFLSRKLKVPMLSSSGFMFLTCLAKIHPGGSQTLLKSFDVLASDFELRFRGRDFQFQGAQRFVKAFQRSLRLLPLDDQILSMSLKLFFLKGDRTALPIESLKFFRESLGLVLRFNRTMACFVKLLTGFIKLLLRLLGLRQKTTEFSGKQFYFCIEAENATLEIRQLDSPHQPSVPGLARDRSPDGDLVEVGLDISGFAPNVAQSAATTLAMRVLLGLVPCVALLGAVALMFGFRLGETEHAAIRSRLAKLRVSPPVESTP